MTMTITMRVTTTAMIMMTTTTTIKMTMMMITIEMMTVADLRKGPEGTPLTFGKKYSQKDEKPEGQATPLPPNHHPPLA